MASTSPMRPPSDGEKDWVTINTKFAARSANRMREIAAFLGLETFKQVVRMALTLLDTTVTALQDGKEVCLRDPRTGEITILKIKKR